MSFRAVGRSVLQRSPSDVVILSAVRSPITRAFKAGFKDAWPEDILRPVMREALRRAKIETDDVKNVLIGNVLAELGFAKTGRMALLDCGFHPSTTFHTVNRQCSSSLQAITHQAHAIMAGQIDVALAGGVESMTRNYGSRGRPTDVSPSLRASDIKQATDCLLTMGETSERIAQRYDITREEQDDFAFRSHQRALVAQASGRFTSETVPVTYQAPGDADQEGLLTTFTVSQDDGIRPNVSRAKLGSLKPVFGDQGRSTAGNSSQISDGASSVILARRSWAAERGLKPIARFAGTQVSGCEPDEMGVGPALAIPSLYKYTGVSQNDIGVFEMNEAFASQMVYCLRALHLDVDKVNPNGGAIALGHPTGATGARQAATLLAEMQRSDHELGIITAGTPRVQGEYQHSPPVKLTKTDTGEKPYACQFCSKRFARGYVTVQCKDSHILTTRSDVLKRHLRSHTAEDEESGLHPPGYVSPSRDRSTSQAAVEMLDPAQDLDRHHFPASLEPSCAHMDVDSRMFQGMLTPDITQQQLIGVGDFSAMLGLPHTPGSVASPGLSNPWDAFFLSMGSPSISDTRSFLSRKHSLGSDIPDERFTKLAKLWPKKGAPQWLLMHTLWVDVICHKATNLFSEASVHNDDHNDSDSLPSEGEDEASRSSRFPTVDTLAVCIDHYFQRFHPVVPFIHEPTFSAKETPNIILAPICLIGLHLLNPSTTREFVANQRTIEKCIVALSKTWERADWSVLVTSLGAAVLLLNYASVLEDECAYSAQTYNLYVKALTVAQQSGLFDISRGRPLPEVLPHGQRDQPFWERWAKVELTASLLATDSLYATKMGLKPAINVDRLRIYATCSDNLFNTLKEDNQEGPGSAIDMMCQEICILDLKVQSTPSPNPIAANAVAVQTLLSVSSLCIAELKVSKLMHEHDPAKNILCPTETSQNGTTEAIVPQLLQAIYIHHDNDFLARDPNAAAFWHNMCMNMSANLNLFELAAGREGIQVAKEALEKISTWADSPHARRACLHAAQVYVCMMRRRITDGTTFMSEVALFNAALVVGLYVYASPSTLQGDTAPRLELLDPVDWNDVGDKGFPGWSPSQSNLTSTASRFISKGGPISFDKMVCFGGYMSSRRVILSYHSGTGTRSR
ncbi:hypothetical protein OPT61_g1393 [Boeremia exigua]|uniref:Uncharacterized protein n=1 Tax=Boeremia exigua TaxID=749465 RepID=A0ACC2IQD2_9PLEO|nr:hypothetical protein OPT61_g1393 [Boeremia exigua]